MKRILTMMMMPAMLALAGCGIGDIASASTKPPPTAVQTGVAAVADTVVLNGAKALLLAEDAYQTANAITTTLVDKGLIKGTLATDVRRLNGKITSALTTGFAAADSTTKAAEAAKAMAWIVDLKSILPGQRK